MIRYFFIILFITIGSGVYAQDFIQNSEEVIDSNILSNDTTALPLDTTRIKNKFLKFNPDRSALLSTIVPGLGQINNKQIYKTPIYPGAIVLGITTGLAARSSFKNIGQTIENTSNIDVRNTLRKRQTNRRHTANGAFIFAGAAYGANIIDAYISAYIKSEDKDHSPLKAGYRSATLPGLGQIYNKQTWKVPVFYTGLIASGGFAIYSLNKKDCYGEIYLNRVRYNYDDLDTELINNCLVTPSQINLFDDDSLLRNRDFHRRNSEVGFIIMSAVYVLNILDAVVFGHLHNFDVDGGLDARLQVRPIFNEPLINHTNYSGIGLKFNL